MIIHLAPLLTVNHDEASHVLIFKPLNRQSMTTFVSNLGHHLQQYFLLYDPQLHCKRVVLYSAKSFHVNGCQKAKEGSCSSTKRLSVLLRALISHRDKSKVKASLPWSLWVVAVAAGAWEVRWRSWCTFLFLTAPPGQEGAVLRYEGHDSLVNHHVVSAIKLQT